MRSLLELEEGRGAEAGPLQDRRVHCVPGPLLHAAECAPVVLAKRNLGCSLLKIRFDVEGGKFFRQPTNPPFFPSEDEMDGKIASAAIRSHTGRIRIRGERRRWRGARPSPARACTRRSSTARGPSRPPPRAAPELRHLGHLRLEGRGCEKERIRSCTSINYEHRAMTMISEKR